MRIRILAVGQKMPAWVNEGFKEYAKRLSGSSTLELVEIPMQKRGKNAAIEKLKEKEAESILQALKPNEKLVVLDVLGKAISTEQLALQLNDWEHEGRNIAIVIGGPDGVTQGILKKSEQTFSLSKLTLPHPLVRVILSEQIYRAWAINQGHPYHR